MNMKLMLRFVQIRSHWYRMMLALESDVELQKKGIIHVAYDVGCRISDHSQRFTDVAMKSHLLRDGVPYRLVAFHYCYDDFAIKTTLSLLRSVSGTQFRLHFRDHFGSHQECQYNLIQFGIPQNMFPLDTNGQLRTTFASQHAIFSHFIANQRRREEEELANQMDSDRIDAATDLDGKRFLFGRRTCPSLRIL